MAQIPVWYSIVNSQLPLNYLQLTSTNLMHFDGPVYVDSLWQAYFLYVNAVCSICAAQIFSQSSTKSYFPILISWNLYPNPNPSNSSPEVDLAILQSVASNADSLADDVGVFVDWYDILQDTFRVLL